MPSPIELWAGGGVTTTVQVAMTVSSFSVLRLRHYQTALQWPLLAAFGHGQKGSKRSFCAHPSNSRAGFRMLGSSPSSSGGARQVQPEQVYVDMVAQRLCAIAASSSRKRLLFVTGAGMSGMTYSCSPLLNHNLLFCGPCVGLRVRPPLPPPPLPHAMLSAVI
jgi:hypothetical protein